MVQLVLAAFLVAPLAEAASCATETYAAHAVVDSGDREDSRGMDQGHAICSHGHCHHTSATRSAPQFVAPQTFGKPPFVTGWHDDPLASVTPDGLMRPPRA